MSDLETLIAELEDDSIGPGEESIDIFSRWGDDRKRAAAALRALKAETEWQPIETAPKDGTPIIGAWKDGKWHARQMRWNDMWDDAWVDDIADCICHPTHWCYLPQPLGQ